MRQILIIIFLLGIVFNTDAQEIIVHSKMDKTYIAYNDSLNKYYKFLKLKRETKKLLDNTKTIPEFTNIAEKYLKAGNHGIHMKYPNDYEVVTYAVNGFNDTFPACIKKVYKPKIKVIYKPIIKIDTVVEKKENFIKVVYQTKTLSGKIREDSSDKKLESISYTEKYIEVK